RRTDGVFARAARSAGLAIRPEPRVSGRPERAQPSAANAARADGLPESGEHPRDAAEFPGCGKSVESRGADEPREPPGHTRAATPTGPDQCDAGAIHLSGRAAKRTGLAEPGLPAVHPGTNPGIHRWAE